MRKFELMFQGGATDVALGDTFNQAFLNAGYNLQGLQALLSWREIGRRPAEGDMYIPTEEEYTLHKEFVDFITEHKSPICSRCNDGMASLRNRFEGVNYCGTCKEEKIEERRWENRNALHARCMLAVGAARQAIDDAKEAVKKAVGREQYTEAIQNVDEAKRVLRLKEDTLLKSQQNRIRFGDIEDPATYVESDVTAQS